MSARHERLVVVGASLAGLRAVEGARANGWEGAITLVGDETLLPYDRPTLSKELLQADTAPELQHLTTAEWLAEHHVDLALGERATAMDPDAGVLQTDHGEHPFTRAVIATGSAPVRLPGTEELGGVFSLRNAEDSAHVRAALDAGARVAVIGAGFIGAEVASAARKRGLDATIIEAAPVPLVRAVGPEMGEVLARLHALHGTDLRCGTGVSGFVGGSQVEAVTLADGGLVEADLVVVGIGTRPAVGWLEGSGIEVDNGVLCDEFLRSSHPSVYAAGDVANWQNSLFGRNMRIEHFTAASEQGMRAGRNAAAPARAESYATVPYFWSDWYDNRIQFAGVATPEFEVVSGALEDSQFVVLYRDGDRLSGVLTLNGQRHVMKYRRLIAQGASYAEAMSLAAARAGA